MKFRIMAWLQPFAAALAFFCCTGFGIPSQRIEYVLTPLLQDGALQAVQIDLTFRGQGDGDTDLRLPDEWGGERELWRGVEGLAVLSGAEMRAGDSPSQRTLTHAPNARIHVRYRVIQDREGAPAAGRNAYRPIIQPTYFHLIGEAALATPDLHNATPVRFRVQRLPRGWSFASDLQHPGLALGHVWASVTVGGDYRVLRAHDRNIRVAIRGQWGFSDESFTAQVGEIIAGHRAFWSDRSSPYLVTVTQTFSPDPGHISVGGTGLDDAFAFFATANADDAPIARTLAHESFHTWIPGRVGGVPEEDEAAHYWFSEGFTDFYTGRMLVHEGLWTPQQFADDLNEMLAAYAQSSVREAPNTRIVADFWNDREVQQLPYQRGRMLATIWDARLRGQDHSLDEALLEMRERALAGDSLQAIELLPVVLGSLGLDIRRDIATYADAGTRILLPEDVFAPCGRVVTRETAVFDRGFDVDALEANNGVISGVDPQSPAYAAGLRDGMVLVRRQAGRIGDSEQQLTYIVRDGAQERTISYYPRGRETYLLQRFEIEEALEGERYAQCRAVLGGREAGVG
jgi:predicted metalloprotease with PDZ domain